MEVKPTYFPSVPRMFEKIYSMAISAAPDKAQLEQAVKLGTKVRQMQAAARRFRRSCRTAFDKADAALFQNVRNIFGGQIKQAVTGRGADRAGDPRVLLRVRRPRARGMGHDGDLDRRDMQHGRGVPVRIGRASRFPVSRSRSPKTARSSRRARTSSAATTRTPMRRARRSSTAGCTRATSARSTRTGSSTSRAARRTSSSRPAARTSRPRTSRTASSRTSTSHRRSCTATGVLSCLR